jgi:hypothetical protein
MDLARQSVQTIAAAVNTGTASALDIRPNGWQRPRAQWMRGSPREKRSRLRASPLP